jgi:hypothetical protein
VSKPLMLTVVESPAGFIPPSGLHDLTCEYLCKDVKPTCVHACKVCDAKRAGEGR